MQRPDLLLIKKSLEDEVEGTILEYDPYKGTAIVKTEVGNMTVRKEQLRNGWSLTANHVGSRVVIRLGK